MGTVIFMIFFKKLQIKRKYVRISRPCVRHEDIWGSEGIVPLILNLYTRRGGHFHTSAALPPAEEPLVPNEQRAGCAPELVSACSANGTAIPRTSSPYRSCYTDSSCLTMFSRAKIVSCQMIGQLEDNEQ
jgi:hypothetical protein